MSDAVVIKVDRGLPTTGLGPNKIFGTNSEGVAGWLDPQNSAGRGIETVTLTDNNLVFNYNDGTSSEPLALPVGAGADGRGIASVEQTDANTLVMSFTDGSQPVMFALPAGPPGEAGPAGADSTVPGPQGEPGATGEQGPAGKSAYQIAVEGGFVGTETEWINSLTPDYAASSATIDGASGEVILPVDKSLVVLSVLGDTVLNVPADDSEPVSTQFVLHVLSGGGMVSFGDTLIVSGATRIPDEAWITFIKEDTGWYVLSPEWASAPPPAPVYLPDNYLTKNYYDPQSNNERTDASWRAIVQAETGIPEDQWETFRQITLPDGTLILSAPSPNTLPGFIWDDELVGWRPFDSKYISEEWWSYYVAGRFVDENNQIKSYITCTYETIGISLEGQLSGVIEQGPGQYTIFGPEHAEPNDVGMDRVDRWLTGRGAGSVAMFTLTSRITTGEAIENVTSLSTSSRLISDRADAFARAAAIKLYSDSRYFGDWGHPRYNDGINDVPTPTNVYATNNSSGIPVLRFHIHSTASSMWSPTYHRDPATGTYVQDNNPWSGLDNMTFEAPLSAFPTPPDIPTGVPGGSY